jgi:hypothetical protein
MGCNGPDDNGECKYEEPVANAGEDVSATLASTANLDGSTSSASCAYALTYTWTLKQAPLSSALDDAVFGSANGTDAAAIVQLPPDVPGTYIVGLTVHDGVATSNEDIVVIDVFNDNTPPIADAGDDVVGAVGERSALDGSGSMDPEGAALDYIWKLASAPSGSILGSTDIYDGDTTTPSLVPDVSGTFVMSLVVSDGEMWSEPDYATIIVAAENQTPIADAGDSSVLAPCENDEYIQLNGNGSFDPEGSAITHQWTVSSVPGTSTATDANFDDATLPNPKFYFDVIGTYTFDLQVFDGELSSPYDQVSLTVVDPSENQVPWANAGVDQTVDLEADCTSTSYVWSCGTCPSIAFEVDGGASTDPDGDTLHFSWTESTGDVTIDTPTLSFSRVWTPVLTTTYGTPTTATYTLDVEVADCAVADTDSVALTVTCTGLKP